MTLTIVMDFNSNNVGVDKLADALRRFADKLEAVPAAEAGMRFWLRDRNNKKRGVATVTYGSEHWQSERRGLPSLRGRVGLDS